MKQKYQIQAVEGVDGLQFLADNPVGRRTYRAGEIVELDDQVHNVKEIMGHGLIRVYEEPVAEPVAAKPGK